MPKGMFLKSQGFASNLSDPEGTHTLEAFCQATGRPYASYGLPVPLDTFVSYGHWFQSELGLELEEVHVDDVTRATAASSSARAASSCWPARSSWPSASSTSPTCPGPVRAARPLHAQRRRTPTWPPSAARTSSSSARASPRWSRRRCCTRTAPRCSSSPKHRWGGTARRSRHPAAASAAAGARGRARLRLGTWFYSNHPELFRRLPQNTRVYRARTALGPAGASWLRHRVEEQFPVTGHSVCGGRGRAGPAGPHRAGGARRELAADHVIAATGYRPDLGRLPFLSEASGRVRTVPARAPGVGRDYQSSVPGLYFVGPGVAPTFGPVMRFVFGTRHAAPVVARHVAGDSGRKLSPVVPASR